MRHLTTVSGSFHARLLAARLGAEDVLVELRGLSEGPYPIQGPVDVFVEGDRLELAREILLEDEVEDAFSVDDEPEEVTGPPEPSGQATASHERLSRRPRGRRVPAVVALGVALLLVLVVVLAAGR
jgi:hypothetical protein